MALPVALVVLLGFCVAVLYRPSTAVAFAVCVYGFEQWCQANSAFFARNSSYINLSFGVITLLAVIAVVLRGRDPINPLTGGTWSFLALFSYAGVSCIWSLDRDTSLFLYQYYLPYILTFSVLLPMCITDKEDMRTGLLATLMFGTVVMLLLVVGTRVHAWGRTIETAHTVVDRVGGERNRLGPLAIAEMAGQVMLIAVLMNFRGADRVWQVSRWAIALLSLALIYRSGSRGQLIAVIFCAIVFIMFSRGTKKLSSWVGACVAGSLIIGFAAFSYINLVDAGQSHRWDLERMQNQFSNTRIEFVSRLLTFWVESSPMNWLFGLGSSASYDTRIIGRYCHVVVVEVLAELGFFGFGIFMLFVYFVTRDSLRLYKYSKGNDRDRGVAVALISLFGYGVVLSFKQGSLITHHFTFAAGLMICRYAAIVAKEAAVEKKKQMAAQWYAYYQSIAHAQQAGSQQPTPG